MSAQLYTMSAAMWIRGMLQHDHGVDLSTISWVCAITPGQPRFAKRSAIAETAGCGEQ